MTSNEASNSFFQSSETSDRMLEKKILQFQHLTMLFHSDKETWKLDCSMCHYRKQRNSTLIVLCPELFDPVLICIIISML